ncbi:hypothetical protein SNEBB_008593 [Seison nebaliae]|nr:hypothetical protein SNEBB_008593 [Seison nebaliae]
MGCDYYQCLFPLNENCPNGYVKFRFYPNETLGVSDYPDYSLFNACGVYKIRTFAFSGFYFKVSFYCPIGGTETPTNICVVLNGMFTERLCLGSPDDPVPPEFDMDMRNKDKIWKKGTKEDRAKLNEFLGNDGTTIKDKKKFRYGILIILIVVLLIVLIFVGIIMAKWKQSFNDQLGNLKEKVHGFVDKRSSFSQLFSRSKTQLNV